MALTILILRWYLVKKNSSWKGVLIQKKISVHHDEDGDESTTLKLVFQKENGKKVKYRLQNQVVFDTYVEGTSYFKVKGKWLPESQPQSKVEEIK